MLVKMTQHAPRDTVYTADAFERSVGHVVPFKYKGQQIGGCTLASYTVAPDGRSVELVLELPDTAFPADLSRGVSFERPRSDS